MMNFEYLLRYYLNSSTLKLKEARKYRNSNSINEFYERYRKNECFYGAFAKLDKNTIVPLLNLPIDFNETDHKILYGIIAPGKTIYAEKNYSLEFYPDDGFDNYIVHDSELQTIADYEENAANDTESSDQIEMSEISESKKCSPTSSFEINKEFQDGCNIDTTKAKMKLQQILDEYRHLGYDVNQDQPSSEKNRNEPFDDTFENSFEAKMDENLDEPSEIEGQNNVSREKNPKISRKKKDFLTTIVDQEVNIRKFSYVIKDQERVLPLYELSFKFDINLELKSKKGNICERCEKNDATMFCVAERAAFCEECDQKIHFDSFTRRHTRHYYSNLGKKQKFFNCLSHPDTVVDYFCEECQIPLCTECRLRGSHSANHKLITYLDADESAKNLKMQNFTSQMLKNEKCLNLVRNEVSKFRKNISEVQDTLDKQYFAIKKELDIFTNKKYQIFNARYLEFWKENRTMVFTQDFVNLLDNSEIIKNYSTILNQQDLQIKEEFRAKYRNIFLHGALSIQRTQDAEGFRKNRSSQLNRTKEFYAESSESRTEKF